MNQNAGNNQLDDGLTDNNDEDDLINRIDQVFKKDERFINVLFHTKEYTDELLELENRCTKKKNLCEIKKEKRVEIENKINLSKLSQSDKNNILNEKLMIIPQINDDNQSPNKKIISMKYTDIQLNPVSENQCDRDIQGDIYGYKINNIMFKNSEDNSYNEILNHFIKDKAKTEDTKFLKCLQNFESI